MKPITGMVGCCARAASDRMATNPAVTLMKSRRRIAFTKAGLRQIARDYSRDLRSAEWGPIIILRGNNPQDRMSALGHKRTSWHFQSMSALPPKADIG
jgi:hypothetical protein